jgi:hypothetical protein
MFFLRQRRRLLLRRKALRIGGRENEKNDGHTLPRTERPALPSVLD